MKPYKKKFYLLSILITILFLSCQEEDVILTSTEGFEQVFRKTSIDDNDELREMISWFGKPGSNARSSYVSTEMGLLDLSEIIERVALESQQAPNYTIRLIPPDSVHGTVEWLVLAHRPSGYVGYILQVEPTGNSSSGLEDLTGFMRVLNFDRIIRSENYFENGLLSGKPSDNSNGRGEDETISQQCWSNCDCHYEPGDAGAGDPINSGATGNQWDPSGESQDMNGFYIVCDCEEVNCSAGGGGPGSGGSSGGTSGGGGPTTGGGGNIGVGTPIGGGGLGGGSGTTGGSSGSSGGTTGGGNGSGSSGGSNNNSNNDPIGLDFSEIDLRCTDQGGGIMINGVCMTEEEYFAVEALNLLLEEDPFTLINLPCEELSNWQNISSISIPPSVEGRLDFLESQTGGLGDLLSLNDDWELQQLKDGSGTAVNMDEFSINATLPPNISPESILEKVRTDFLDQLSDATFTPHPNIIGEFDKWNNAETSLGSILSIDMLDNGSVICIQKNSTSWTFTTIEDPYNYAHPVSGNRQFGFEENSDGSFTFYTRGVDRMTNFVEAAVRDIVNFSVDIDMLDLANPVWESYQSLIFNHINNLGGSASIEHPVVYRPNYNELAEFLAGEIPLEELKGCE